MKTIIVIITFVSFVFAANVTIKIRLNNGIDCPLVGLGTGGHRTGGPPQDQLVIQMIHDALDAGYRHIDTASSYRNEKAIGQAINDVLKQGKVKREDIFITTKIFGGSEMNLKRGKQEAIDYVKQSLEKLNSSYIDLMLIHRPSNDSHADSEVWSGLEDVLHQGLVKSIGVSNFDIEHLSSLLKTAKVIPAMNQVECYPQMNQRELIDYCNNHSIKVTAYSPLGAGTLLNDTTIVGIGKKHNKSSAQVMIRWQIQRGVVAIPKSTKKERIKENIEVFDFSLTNDEMKVLDDMKY